MPPCRPAGRLALSTPHVFALLGEMLLRFAQPMAQASWRLRVSRGSPCWRDATPTDVNGPDGFGEKPGRAVTFGGMRKPGTFVEVTANIVLGLAALNGAVNPWAAYVGLAVLGAFVRGALRAETLKAPRDKMTWLAATSLGAGAGFLVPVLVIVEVLPAAALGAAMIAEATFVVFGYLWAATKPLNSDPVFKNPPIANVLFGLGAIFGSLGLAWGVWDGRVHPASGLGVYAALLIIGSLGQTGGPPGGTGVDPDMLRRAASMLYPLFGFVSVGAVGVWVFGVSDGQLVAVILLMVMPFLTFAVAFTAAVMQRSRTPKMERAAAVRD